MPDGPRESFRPTPRLAPRRAGETGFHASNTSGLTAREIAILNRVLARLMAFGLSEPAAKLAIDAAVRDGLEPADACDADLDRILAWR